MPRQKKLSGDGLMTPKQRATVAELKTIAEDSKALQSTPPNILHGEAIRAYRRLYPILKEQGLVTGADLDLVINYCINVQIIRDAYKNLNDYGAVISNPQGQPIKNPSVLIIDATSKTLRGLGNELGLSPQARASLITPDDDDALDIGEVKNMFG